MVKLVNRAKMTTDTTGTGDSINLVSAVDGFQSFADAGVANGDIVRYCIEDGNNFEIGSGTYTSSGTTLSRLNANVVESSESDNSKITLSGSAVVFSTVAAQDFGEGPIITTEPPSAHTLSHAGSTTSLTMFAKDPDGFPVTYGIAYPTTNNALPAQLASATTINQSTGAYTFTPSTSTSDAGTVKVRLSASDGVRNTTRLSTLSLAFQLDFDVLVIGGGGGGGTSSAAVHVSAGGGAGGVIALSYTNQSTSTFTITIGAGGAADSDGGDTTFEQTTGTGFSTLTAGGGGGGGGSPPAYPDPGRTGRASNGSGGGGTGGGNAGSGGGAGTSAHGGQGYPGAAGMNSSPYAGGGGGGSGEAGGTDANGDGGDGLQSSITGTATYYAGGGGGGVENTTLNVQGGLGGGGSGGQIGGRTATAATGYGSGGAGQPGGLGSNLAGTAGSSGVVIIASTVAATATTGSPSLDSSSRTGYFVYTFASNGTISLTAPS